VDPGVFGRKDELEIRAAVVESVVVYVMDLVVGISS